MVSAIIIAVALVIGFTAHQISKKPDSQVEQVAESVLKDKGIDIDFSKEQKEKNSKEK